MLILSRLLSELLSMKALLWADQLGGQEEVGSGQDLGEAEPEVGVAVSLAHQPPGLLTSPELTLGVQELDNFPPRQ